MALIGVSITKSVVFRDSVQEFSNTYHYTWLGTDPDSSFASDIIDALVALEKPLHGSTVSFVRARLWSAGGTKAENQMILTKSLSGVGTSANGTSGDKERAYLIFWDAGVDSRGHPVKLRKWMHLQAQVVVGQLSTGVINQDTGFTSTQQSTTANAFNPFTDLTVSGHVSVPHLCAASGREANGAPHCHKYYENHELGDQWRG